MRARPSIHPAVHTIVVRNGENRQPRQIFFKFTLIFVARPGEKLAPASAVPEVTKLYNNLQCLVKMILGVVAQPSTRSFTEAQYSMTPEGRFVGVTRLIVVLGEIKATHPDLEHKSGCRSFLQGMPVLGRWFTRT